MNLLAAMNTLRARIVLGEAALVTESGGPLSHGAVTARELRLPAVLSVRDCLTRLQNGMRVRVNGTVGRVELLDEASGMDMA